jgi:hypothetical protein
VLRGVDLGPMLAGTGIFDAPVQVNENE